MKWNGPYQVKKLLSWNVQDKDHRTIALCRYKAAATLLIKALNAVPDLVKRMTQEEKSNRDFLKSARQW